MDSSKHHKRFLSLFATLILAALLLISSARAQDAGQTPVPSPTGRVNDFAGVVDASVKERLEKMLANLKERGGIEFSIVLVKSTEGKKIFDYSLQFARQWKIGEMQSKDSSLLLLISTDDGQFLAQVSHGLGSKMPEDLIGQMGSKMQAPISKGNYGEALTAAVQTFITPIAEKLGFSTEGMDQAQTAPTTTVTPTPAATTTTITTATATDSLPQSTPEPASAKPTETKETAAAPPSPKESTAPETTRESATTATPTTKEPATTEPAATEPSPTETTSKETATKEATTTEPATTESAAKGSGSKAAPAKQRSLREVFTKDNSAKEPATKTVAVARDVPEKSELDAILQLSPAEQIDKLTAFAEQIEKLKAFIETYPRSSLKTFATEKLIGDYAALGDEKLQAGDVTGGLTAFTQALAQMPDKMSDALFVKVISQIPTNLYLRGQHLASLDAAHFIETKVKDDPKRLLALASFYLSIEEADEAARVSEIVIQLAPDMAAAHQALGAARHIALRLDDAASEYARALELDPKLTSARRSLADLRRASGKTEDALALYREQLTADPADKSARAGIVLSLLDQGKKEEAERELDAALKDDASNLPLLVGASYWYAAHNEPARAQELATAAIRIEPRYTWAHIALARALIAQKQPLEAERVLRFARSYGRFPTLDYELASALAASGLYEEAATELARSFTIKDGQIETHLAGRATSHAASFIELLAPERRAGIFQPTAADTEANARMLKGLLALSAALNNAQGQPSGVDAALLSSAQDDFLAGDDQMLAYRQLYVASRLLQRGVALPRVVELSEAASSGVEAALDAPAATVAVMADELRSARAQAVAAGQALTVGEVQRRVLANILRGYIEDLTGWSLFNQEKTSEALTHLRRALSVLPEHSAWWRAAQWHLGATLAATGNQQEALAAYIKGYNPAAPDPVRRAIIETLYRKLNGSLDGLDAMIGPASSVSSNTNNTGNSSTPAAAPTKPTETPQPTTSPMPQP